MKQNRSRFCRPLLIELDRELSSARFRVLSADSIFREEGFVYEETADRYSNNRDNCYDSVDEFLFWFVWWWGFWLRWLGWYWLGRRWLSRREACWRWGRLRWCCYWFYRRCNCRGWCADLRLLLRLRRLHRFSALCAELCTCYKLCATLCAKHDFLFSLDTLTQDAIE